MSCILTSAPTLPLASAMLVAKYTDENAKRAIKLALKIFFEGQKQAQSQMPLPALKPQERSFKACLLDFYYNNYYIDCYWFCQ